MKKIINIWLIVSAFLYATVPTEESVTKLYIATFDRVPDAAGLAYWMNESQLSLEEIAQSFFDQPETKAKYPSDVSNGEFINIIYQNILERNSDSAGYDYWLKELNSKKIDRSVFILALINGALDDDKKLLENKTTVGLAFVGAGKNNLNDAREILNGVTIDDATADEALKRYGLGIDILDPLVLSKLEVDESIAKEWYVRIVVEDVTNNMKSSGSQIGQLKIGDVVIQHTLKAIEPFRPTYLDVVFINPVGVDAGSYKTNFHASSTDADSWEFTVKSHDSNANMILGWRGLYVLDDYVDSQGRTRYHEYRSMTNLLLTYMTLVDTVTNTEINILENNAVNEYVFNMNGAITRIFRWKMKDTSSHVHASFGSSKKEIISPEAKEEKKLRKLQIQALRKDAKARPDALKKTRLESLDMMTPPVFEVLVK